MRFEDFLLLQLYGSFTVGYKKVVADLLEHCFYIKSGFVLELLENESEREKNQKCRQNDQESDFKSQIGKYN